MQTIRHNPKVMLGLSAVVNLALAVVVVLVQLGSLSARWSPAPTTARSSDSVTAGGAVSW